MLDCVACGGEIPEGSERYANSWESVRKRYPCCGSQCCSTFDPDLHWLPAVLPTTPSSGEEAKLLRVARRRLEAGDPPRVVVRELLLAGVSVPAARKVVNEALMVRTREREDAARLPLFGGLFGMIAAIFSMHVSRDDRRSSATEHALDDLDRWEQHMKAKV